jgi:arginase
MPEAEAMSEAEAMPMAEAALIVDPTPAAGSDPDLAPAPVTASDPDLAPASAVDGEPASEVDALDDIVSEPTAVEDSAAEEDSVSFVTRPLGQAPLLDSEPLPATRPGMLRPRAAEERSSGELPAADGFSLPTQRPAFDLGSGSPADIA